MVSFVRYVFIKRIYYTGYLKITGGRDMDNIPNEQMNVQSNEQPVEQAVEQVNAQSNEQPTEQSNVQVDMQYGAQQQVQPNMQYGVQQQMQYGVQQQMQYGAQQQVQPNMQYGAQQQMQQGMQYGVQQPVQPKPVVPRKPIDKKLLKKVGIFAAIVIIAIIAVNVYLNVRKVTIDISKYITIECEGYDTKGNASYIFDYEKFCDDYDDKIKIYKGKKERGSSVEETFIRECFMGGTFDVSTNLSNGDKIVFTMNLDTKKALEKYHIKFKTDTVTAEVKGLENVDVLDPFADLSVSFTGISPYGSVTIQNNSSNSIIRNLNYEVSQSYDLKNGDIITITVNYDEYSMINNYGVTLSESSKEYAVEGLSEYVTSLADIPEDTMTKMQQQANDVFTANVAQNWAENLSADAFNFMGCYMLTPKTGEYSDHTNLVYLVYKVTATVSFPEDGVADTFDYYLYVSFYDLLMLQDGTCSLDYSDYGYSYNEFKHITQHGDGSSSYWFYGYEDLDTLFNKVIAANVDRYNYESTVTE